MIVTMTVDTEKDEEIKVIRMMNAERIVYACQDFDSYLRGLTKYPDPANEIHLEMIQSIRDRFHQDVGEYLGA